MPAPELPIPARINEFRVIETGAFAEPRLPSGYVPPSDGQPLRPVQNVAICEADGVEGYYTLFCTDTWEYVTYEFHETRESAKRNVIQEFGADVTGWQVRA
jgi:hypothetical protein